MQFLITPCDQASPSAAGDEIKWHNKTRASIDRRCRGVIKYKEQSHCRKRKMEYVARQMAEVGDEAEQTYYFSSADHPNYNKWLAGWNWCGGKWLKEDLLSDRTDVSLLTRPERNTNRTWTSSNGKSFWLFSKLNITFLCCPPRDRKSWGLFLKLNPP